MGSPFNCVDEGDDSQSQSPTTRLWCRLTLEDVEGHTLQGSIPLILKPGQFKFPDTANVQAQDGRWIQDWIKEAGLPPHGDTESDQAQFASDMATMCAYFLPSLEPGTDAMKIYMWIMTLSFLGDDVLEGRDFLGRDPNSGTDLVTVVGDIFRGKFPTYESIPFRQDAFGLKTMVKAGFFAAQKAQEHLPHFFEQSAHMAEAISSAYGAMLAMELEDHYDDMSDLPVDSYRYFRKYEGGFEGLIELAFLCRGAVPTEGMRRNVIFKRILDLAWSINVNINDLFSVRKELSSGVGYNLVGYKSRIMDLPQAFGEVVKVVQEDVLNLTALCTRYRVLNPGNKLVESVLSVLEQMVDGHVHWYAVNKRYGDIKVEFVER